MKAQPIKQEEGRAWEVPPEDATHLQINLPTVGCLLLPIVTGNKTRKETPCWSWNGDMEKPTLKPSILNDPFYNGPKTGRNHCFVNDGMVKFLNDCTHELKGKTVELLEVDREFFKPEEGL